MRLPSKVTSFKESSLSRFPLLMSRMEKNDVSPYELYEETSKHFETIEDFIDTLDFLYAIGKISFDKENGRITNVI